MVSMKRYCDILLIVLMVICPISACAHDFSYKHDGRECRLTPVPSLTVQGAIFDSVTGKVNEGYELVLSEKKPEGNFVRKKVKNRGNAMPTVYLSESGDTVILTNRVIVKMKDQGLEEIHPLMSKYDAVVSREIKPGLVVLELAMVSQVFDFLDGLYENSAVEWAEPDLVVPVNQCSYKKWWKTQYYLYDWYQHASTKNNINVYNAWSVSRGCQSVKVAILDDGLCAHEGLESPILPGYSVFSTGETTPNSDLELYHGLACAGIIGGWWFRREVETEVLRGISPQVSLIPVKVTEGLHGATPVSSLADAIYWSISSSGGNADVLCCSWGISTESYVVREAILDAQEYGRGGDYVSGKKGLGCVVVFPSGNEGNGQVSYLSRYAISVGAIQQGETIATDKNGVRYSNIGTELDLVAFGGKMTESLNTGNEKADIVTLGKNNSLLLNFGGTSAACAQVCGAAALLLSMKPELHRAEVETLLFSTAQDLGTAGKDNTFGYGKLNVFGAVKQLLVDNGSQTIIFDNDDFTSNGLVAIDKTCLVTGAPNLSWGYYMVEYYQYMSNKPMPDDAWVWMHCHGVERSNPNDLGASFIMGNGYIILKFMKLYSQLGQELGWYPYNPTLPGGIKFEGATREVVKDRIISDVILSGESRIVKAAKSVTLNPGFEVMEGGAFEAIITDEDFVNVECQ